jgi:hypothetical protein
MNRPKLRWVLLHGPTVAMAGLVIIWAVLIALLT